MLNALLLTAITFLWLVTILDVVRTDATKVLRIPKAGWLFTVVVMPVVGSLGWVLLGRPRTSKLPPLPEIGLRWPVGPEDYPDWSVDTVPSRPKKTTERNPR